MISRKDITVPDFYKKYIEAVEKDDLLEALNRSTKQIRKLLRNIPKKKIDYAYAEGKWTIKQLLQHIIDAERVFAFRAMWFVRKDPNPLPGFDENTWAENADVSKRKWKDMIEELLNLREVNNTFFASLSDEQLQSTGTANNSTLSTAAMGFVSAGHIMHHINIIKERYLPKPGKKTKDKLNPAY